MVDHLDDELLNELSKKEQGSRFEYDQLQQQEIQLRFRQLAMLIQQERGHNG
jgi:hypothetical protein